MDSKIFKKLIVDILKEEIEKRSSTNQKIYPRLPEVVHGEDYKEITPYKRDDKTKNELLDDITKLVKGIDNSFTAVWDDFDTISISGRDLFSIRILPRFENNYSIEAMVRNEDRFYIVNQTWDQVKQFIKNNLKGSKTGTEKAWDKVVYNRSEDRTPSPDKGMPQKDKPKTLPLTSTPPSESKNKEKDYTEKQVKKDDDLPEKPMKEVDDYKKLSDYKVKDPVKLRKRKPDTKLVVKK